MPVAGDAEVGGRRKEPRPPQHESPFPIVERQAGTLLPACGQQADRGQRQEPPYLPGVLLVEEPQGSRLAVLADAAWSTPTRATTRTALWSTSLVYSLGVWCLFSGLTVARSAVASWGASRPVVPPE